MLVFVSLRSLLCVETVLMSTEIFTGEMTALVVSTANQSTNFPLRCDWKHF